MERLKLPFSLVFYTNSQVAIKRLSDIQTKDLIDLYGKEEDEDVRQAMAPELAKRLSDIIKRNEFDFIF